MVKFQGLDSNQQPKGSLKSGKHATSEAFRLYGIPPIPVFAPNRPIPVLLVQRTSDLLFYSSNLDSLPIRREATRNVRALCRDFFGCLLSFLSGRNRKAFPEATAPGA
jgi:hypothetical protein